MVLYNLFKNSYTLNTFIYMWKIIIVLYLHESDSSSVGNVVVGVVDGVGHALDVGSAALKWNKRNSQLFIATTNK